ncbi:MAG: hypothetical protein ABSC48_19400 [Terracidiphilus sp.]
MARAADCGLAADCEREWRTRSRVEPKLRAEVRDRGLEKAIKFAISFPYLG